MNAACGEGNVVRLPTHFGLRGVDATAFERLEADDALTVIETRFRRLSDAGFGPQAALLLAVKVEIDVDVATRVVQRRNHERGDIRMLAS